MGSEFWPYKVKEVSKLFPSIESDFPSVEVQGLDIILVFAKTKSGMTLMRGMQREKGEM